MLKDFLLSIIGSYTISDSIGVQSLDFPWIFAALVFIVAMASTYWLIGRLLGGLFRE